MINECLMLLRRRKGIREEVLQDEIDASDTTLQGAARLNLKEMKVLLENAISALPRNLRTVYVLREVQHMTTDEAAACLGISAANIKVTLHRARERLKTILLDSAAGLELFQYRAEFCDPMTARVMGALLQG